MIIIKNATVALAGVTLIVVAGFVGAQEMPQPSEEHEWLQRFVGEWSTDVKIFMDPDGPPTEVQVAETFRPVGGFWVVGDMESRTEEMPFSGVYTIGYDSETGNYIGFWIESMTGNLMNYRGSVNAAGDVLTMKAEGACPMRPGELTKFREVTEFKSDDYRRITSAIYVDGEWVENVTIESRRK